MCVCIHIHTHTHTHISLLVNHVRSSQLYQTLLCYILLKSWPSLTLFSKMKISNSKSTKQSSQGNLFVCTLPIQLGNHPSIAIASATSKWLNLPLGFGVCSAATNSSLLTRKHMLIMGVRCLGIFFWQTTPLLIPQTQKCRAALLLFGHLECSFSL